MKTRPWGWLVVPHNSLDIDIDDGRDAPRRPAQCKSGDDLEVFVTNNRQKWAFLVGVEY